RSLASSSDQLAQRPNTSLSESPNFTPSLSEQCVAQRPTPEIRLRLETCLGHA
ncbi:hypothetical protein A2U01_0096350, partial [Trifolium medium]|nr:hypothetical protein [Trifolium medium]